MSNEGLSQKPLEDPRKGDLCLALFSVDKLYYRAIITKVYTEGKAEIKKMFVCCFLPVRPGSFTN